MLSNLRGGRERVSLHPASPSLFIVNICLSLAVKDNKNDGVVPLHSCLGHQRNSERVLSAQCLLLDVSLAPSCCPRRQLSCFLGTRQDLSSLVISQVLNHTIHIHPLPNILMRGLWNFNSAIYFLSGFRQLTQAFLVSDSIFCKMGTVVSTF